jgi:hypothetical protein
MLADKKAFCRGTFSTPTGDSAHDLDGFGFWADYSQSFHNPVTEELASQIDVAGFCDAELRISITGLTASSSQA